MAWLGKAASYLAVSRAVFRVPGFASRWTNSECQWAMEYNQKGTHMAFAVTLAATYEEKSSGDVISIPKLIKRFRTAPLLEAIARDQHRTHSEVEAAARKAVRKFERIKALPIYGSLRKLRHNVIAHHNREIDRHGATPRALNRLMVATLVLVDRMSITLNAETTDTRDIVAYVRDTAVKFWDRGMDGDPTT